MLVCIAIQRPIFPHQYYCKFLADIENRTGQLLIQCWQLAAHAAIQFWCEAGVMTSAARPLFALRGVKATSGL